MSQMNNSTLQEADNIINGDRQDQYGNPENAFEKIATLWQFHLDNRKPAPLSNADVAIMLAYMKFGRMYGTKHKRDTAIDICGYMAIYNDKLTNGVE